MTKKLRLHGGYNYFVENLPDGGDGGGYNYFENLADELVIVIFTKLSSSSSNDLDDIKSLGRCSAVSKRFDALTCLVPTLSLRHPDIETLYEWCPKILKKFKHIRSLQVTHWSSTEMRMRSQHKPLPFIFWEAAYRPHSYRLSFVSYQKFSHYADPQKQQSLMDAAKDDAFLELTRDHNFNMICLHHMLVSSIKDHIYLQKVVVSDFNDRGTLTLEDDMLVELRNCTSPIFKKEIWARDRSGSVINLDVPSLKPRSGVVMNNFYFSITEWSEWDTEYHYEGTDDESGLPRDMHFKCHQGVNLSKVLASVIQDADDVKLDARRAEVVSDAANKIQRRARTHIARKHFLALRDATICLQSFCRGSITGSTLLVAGTTIGAGILAIPAVTQDSGFLASAVTCILCWIYMVVTGLLIAEVNVKTMSELGSGGVSLLVLYIYSLCPSRCLCRSFLRHLDTFHWHSYMGKCNPFFIAFWWPLLLWKSASYWSS